ncbi:MAG TPA: hypothetical protein VD701_03955 [Steroidobacteraceae bacterium]|nr:hypothetical protein [Steroidobacteraceae bacterium]
MVASASAAVPAASNRFYLAMALTCALVAILGFAPTYWAPLAAGTLAEAPIVHLHAVLFTAWSAFFVAQAALIAGGRVARHRALGLVGISLATGMLLVGLATAIHSTELQIAMGHADRARGFMIVPVTTILFFACAVAFAIANRTRPEIHKRVMLVASIAILMAAVGRIVRFTLGRAGLLGGPPPIEFSILPALLTDLLIVAAMVHDRRARGRVHPAYWIGGGAWLAVQLGRIPLSKTPMWQAIVDWLLAF